MASADGRTQDANGLWVFDPSKGVPQPDGSIVYPDGHVSRPDKTSAYTDPASGVTTNYGADGKPTGVTDKAGSALTPGGVEKLNNENSSLPGGVLPGLGTNPVSTLLPIAGGAFKEIKNELTGNDGSEAAADKARIQGAAGNLGKWDPNAPNTQDFGDQQGVATQVAPPTTVVAPGAVAPPSVDFDAGLVTPGSIGAAPVIGAAPSVSAPQLGAAPQIGAGSAGGTGVTATNVATQTAAPVADIAAGGIGRDAQVDALGGLKDAAEGKTESAAQWLMRKGIDENVGAAYGLAASLQGRNPGIALRTGAITAKDAIAKSAADMAALRATEMQKNREAYAALGSTIAAQDLAAMQSNQSKDLTLSVTNLQEKIKVLQGNQQAQLQAGMATAANATAASIATLTAQTQTAIANLQTSTARDIANQTAQLDASKANAANAVAVQIANANNEMTALVENLHAQTAANDRNAATITAKQIAELDSRTKVLMQQQDQIYDAAKTNAANQARANEVNATNSTNVSISNAALEERKRADMAAADAKLKELGLTSLIAQLNASIQVAKTDADIQAAEDSFWASIAGTAGKVYSGK